MCLLPEKKLRAKKCMHFEVFGVNLLKIDFLRENASC